MPVKKIGINNLIKIAYMPLPGIAQHNTTQLHFVLVNSNNNNNRDPKVLAMSGSNSVGGSDRLTRDFLGVGQIVRGMSGSGGVAQREQQQQHGFNLSSLEAERYNNNSNNAAPSSGQAFGGGGGIFQ